MQAWPRAISDFGRALEIEPYKVEILVLRAAAWRHAGNTDKALADADRALTIAPDNADAVLERGFALLARGDRRSATAEFNRVLKLAPTGSTAAKRAAASLRGEAPSPPAASKR
jgi:tetratricopeptide (TPR) repeat protein